jgi:P27 family predicted phage terminase small subunit
LKTPAELGEDAKKEWRRVARELHQCGLLTTIDRVALAAYCDAYGRWAQATKALAQMAEADPTGRSALLVKTSNGTAVQNPLIGIANKAAADMVRYASEFGMTPSARSRVHVDQSGKRVEDPTRKYF